MKTNLTSWEVKDNLFVGKFKNFVEWKQTKQNMEQDLDSNMVYHGI